MNGTEEEPDSAPVHPPSKRGLCAGFSGKRFLFAKPSIVRLTKEKGESQRDLSWEPTFSGRHNS